jgi:tetratricopeptide (TPR) repeat protein
MKLTKRDFVLFIIIIYFTFIGGTFYSQLNFLLRLANQFIVTGILGWWLVGKLKNKIGLPGTALDDALFLYVSVNLLSVVLGQSSRFSLESIWFTVIHTLAFYLLVDLGRSGWTPKLTWAFYMTSAVVCLVALTEFTAWYVGTPLIANFAQGWLEIGGWRQPIPPSLYRLSITLNGATPLSAYLALLTPPAIALMVSLPARDENRKALLIWLVLALVVQVLTFSRAGVLALGVSLPLFVIGWRQAMGRSWPNIRQYWAQLRRWAQVAIAAGSLLAVGLSLFWLQHSFANRAHSTDFRLALWEAAGTIFQEHWLTGAGPANFGRALLRLNETEFPRLQISTAHSIYFNTAAELGLLGLIAGLALFLMMGWAWRRRWRQTVDPSERIRLAACGAALVGLAAQTLVDTYMATPNMLVMLALMAYIVTGLESPEITPIHKALSFMTRLRPYMTYLVLAGLLVYLGWFVWLARADLAFRRSIRQEGAGNLREAIAQATQAQALDPGLALWTFRVALLEARLADQTGNSTLLQAAIGHYQAGLAQEPILGLNSANLAGLLWQQGNQSEAIALLERTIAVERQPLYLVNLGYFYEQSGDWTKARRVYSEALSLSPELAASGFWQAAPERAEKWPEFVEAVVSPIPERAAQKAMQIKLALAQEEVEGVKALLEAGIPAPDEPLQAILAEFYLDQGQPDQASVWLKANPDNAQSYLLWGRLKLQLGEEVAAETLLKTAVFLGNSKAHYYLGQLFERRGDLPAAIAAYQQGFSPRVISENIEVTIYGRFGGNDFAPQLLRIGQGRRSAQAALALAKLYEKEQRFEEAGWIYELLLAEDPFFDLAQERLEALEAKSLP